MEMVQGERMDLNSQQMYHFSMTFKHRNPLTGKFFCLKRHPYCYNTYPYILQDSYGGICIGYF